MKITTLIISTSHPSPGVLSALTVGQDLLFAGPAGSEVYYHHAGQGIPVCGLESPASWRATYRNVQRLIQFLAQRAPERIVVIGPEYHWTAVLARAWSGRKMKLIRLVMPGKDLAEKRRKGLVMKRWSDEVVVVSP